MGSETVHPERFCQRCGGANPTWHAPNELWNQVTGHPPGLIICPCCFEKLAAVQMIAVDTLVDRLDNILERDSLARLSAENAELRKELKHADGMYDSVVCRNDSAWSDILSLVYAIMGWEEGHGIDEKDIADAVERAKTMRVDLAVSQMNADSFRGLAGELEVENVLLKKARSSMQDSAKFWMEKYYAARSARQTKEG